MALTNEQNPMLAKAWANINGDTGTINDSWNISSMTDYGVGQYSVTLDITMTHARYPTVVTASFSGPTDGNVRSCREDDTAKTTTSVRVFMSRVTGTAEDNDNITIMVFGDRL